MEKKIATYLLGVAMGIIIMAFLNVLIFDTNTNEKALLDLKKSYESLLEEKNNLQAQLEGIENRIAVERRNFNQSVQSYNATLRTFPNNLFAGWYGFERKGYFEAAQGAETAPTVQF